MASLAEIEASYYREIEASTLSETAQSEVATSSEVVSMNAFKDWVKRLDIYDFEKEKADFYMDEEIVTSFTNYRKNVVAELPKCDEYDGIKHNGQLKNIGSCQDGSKVGKMNEANSLYVLDADTSVENIGKEGVFKIILKTSIRNCEIKPRSMRKQFANGYAEVISKLPLPGCMEHAGYNSPAYSGLRYNGPSATS